LALRRPLFGVPLKTPTATIGVLVVQHYQNENTYDVRDWSSSTPSAAKIGTWLSKRRRAEEECAKTSPCWQSSVRTQSAFPRGLYDVESLRFCASTRRPSASTGYSGDEFKTHEYP